MYNLNGESYTTGINTVLAKCADYKLATAFRRDQYLIPHNIHELMLIDKIIRNLPLQKKQAE